MPNKNPSDTSNTNTATDAVNPADGGFYESQDHAATEGNGWLALAEANKAQSRRAAGIESVTRAPGITPEAFFKAKASTPDAESEAN